MAKLRNAGVLLDPSALQDDLRDLEKEVIEVVSEILREKLRAYIDRVNQTSINKRARLIELGADPKRIPEGQDTDAPLRGRRGASVRKAVKQGGSKYLVRIESRIFQALDTGREPFSRSKPMFFFKYEEGTSHTIPDSLDVGRVPDFIRPLQLARRTDIGPTQPRNILQKILEEIEDEIADGKHTVQLKRSRRRVVIRPDDVKLTVRG